MEAITRTPITPTDYSDFVSNSRFQNMDKNWKKNSADYLSGEFLETITQHGGAEAVVALLPEALIPGYEPTDISQETRYAMADEIGDTLWFLVDALDRVDSSIATATTAAFKAHGIEVDGTIMGFEEIQRLALDNADVIRHISKAGLLMGYTDITETPERLTTSLRENPLVMLTRTTRRVTRSLEDGQHDVAPYASAAEHEPVAELELAIGQHIITLAYILENRLGVTLNGVATFNRDKLVNRAAHGKQNDIHFDETYAGL